MSGTSTKNINLRVAKGFTLVELMITIAVVVILMAIAIPSFRNLMSSNTVNNIYYDLMSSMRTARAEAVTRGVAIRVKAVSSNWNGGWSVVTADDTELHTYPARDSRFEVTPSPTVSEVSFNGRGALTAQACFNIKDSSGASSNEKYIKVLKSGSVQTASSCT